MKEILYRDIVLSQQTLKLISDHDFGDSSFNIDVAIFIKELDDKMKFYYEEYNKLVTKYGTKIEGKVQIPFDSPNFPEFNQRVIELQEKKIKINILPITKHQMLGVKGMAASHFLSIIWLVDCLKKDLKEKDLKVSQN